MGSQNCSFIVEWNFVHLSFIIVIQPQDESNPDMDSVEMDVIKGTIMCHR